MRPVDGPRGPFPLTCGGAIDYVRSAHQGWRGRRGTATTGGAARRRATARSPITGSSPHRNAYPDMFSSDLAPRHPPSLASWSWPGFALAAALRLAAPSWDQVTKDDNVRFFPPDFPSVVGQSLLERGFPRDAASSQVVLVCERADGPLTPQDFALRRRHGRPVLPVRPGALPSWASRSWIPIASPVIGPRLLGDGGDGRAQAVLTIVSLNGTYLAKTTRIAVDRHPGVGRAGAARAARGPGRWP